MQVRHGVRGLAVGTALLAVALVGCSSDDTSTDTGDSSTTAGDSSTTAPAGSSELEGQFLSDSVEGHELVEGTSVSLTFTDGQLSANAGCNTIAGGYSTDGDQLVIEGELAMTMMACEGDGLTDQDAWLSEWLASGLSFTLDDTELTLTGDDVTMTLSEVAAGEGGTVEGSWTLDSIVEGETASSVPAGVDSPTLDFTDGSVGVFGGCNSGSAEVTVSEDTITFGPIAMTMMACEGDAGSLETTVTTVLMGDVAYTIAGDKLTVGDDELSLVYVKS